MGGDSYQKYGPGGFDTSGGDRGGSFTSNHSGGGMGRAPSHGVGMGGRDLDYASLEMNRGGSTTPEGTRRTDGGERHHGDFVSKSSISYADLAAPRDSGERDTRRSDRSGSIRMQIEPNGQDGDASRMVERRQSQSLLPKNSSSSSAASEMDRPSSARDNTSWRAGLKSPKANMEGDRKSSIDAKREGWDPSVSVVRRTTSSSLTLSESSAAARTVPESSTSITPHLPPVYVPEQSPLRTPVVLSVKSRIEVPTPRSSTQSGVLGTAKDTFSTSSKREGRDRSPTRKRGGSNYAGGVSDRRRDSKDRDRHADRGRGWSRDTHQQRYTSKRNTYDNRRSTRKCRSSSATRDRGGGWRTSTRPNEGEHTEVQRERRNDIDSIAARGSDMMVVDATSQFVPPPPPPLPYHATQNNFGQEASYSIGNSDTSDKSQLIPPPPPPLPHDTRPEKDGREHPNMSIETSDGSQSGTSREVYLGVDNGDTDVREERLEAQSPGARVIEGSSMRPQEGNVEDPPIMIEAYAEGIIDIVPQADEFQMDVECEDRKLILAGKKRVARCDEEVDVDEGVEEGEPRREKKRSKKDDDAEDTLSIADQEEMLYGLAEFPFCINPPAAGNIAYRRLWENAHDIRIPPDENMRGLSLEEWLLRKYPSLTNEELKKQIEHDKNVETLVKLHDMIDELRQLRVVLTRLPARPDTQEEEETQRVMLSQRAKEKSPNKAGVEEACILELLEYPSSLMQRLMELVIVRMEQRDNIEVSIDLHSLYRHAVAVEWSYILAQKYAGDLVFCEHLLHANQTCKKYLCLPDHEPRNILIVEVKAIKDERTEDFKHKKSGARTLMLNKITKDKMKELNTQVKRAMDWWAREYPRDKVYGLSILKLCKDEYDLEL